ncbi:hypothetical protein CACET_c01960 [Clostridium aceticum]|uniref:Uncharacterized protein n=1 Tax=Clostridium aceticum TaxID=84022 RepID=A0A0D8I636_9CLOT|nr:hypothetical protein [Clostridium aceticum]AKL93712.1 hypothetical protein CACET_c01960 [Clostridium aceticum]KJF25760.1 hypothetical protein TZ02_16250 [Clostridium aceticum]
MENTFLNTKIDDSMHETAGELLEALKKAMTEKSPAVNSYFRAVKNLGMGEFFPYIVEILKETEESIYRQYGFQALSTIPQDIDMVRKYIPDIMKMIESTDEPKVVYQGVLVLYRISKNHPELDPLLNRKSISISLPVFQDALKLVNNLEKWEADFHKNSGVRSELRHPDTFLNFANQFIKL